MKTKVGILYKQLQELRDDFIDYVCSGVDNPAHYCEKVNGNKCLDSRGWCLNNEYCHGFRPIIYYEE